MKLLIASPAIDGKFEGDYIGALIQTLVWAHTERIEVEWYFCRGVSEISRGRDGIAAYALRGSFDKLLFVDADESWTAENVASLLRSDKRIIGGTYAKKELPYGLNFGCLPEHNEYFADGGRKSPEAYTRWAKECANAEGEVEIAFLPTGFMLIDCSVFRELQEFAPSYLSVDAASGAEVRNWEFFPVGVFAGKKDTEDWGFCRFARSCGISVWLQTRAVVSHFGTFRYRPSRDELPS